MFFLPLRLALISILIIFSLGSALVWLLPVEFAQDWAFRHAAANQFAQHEAIGIATAIWNVARFSLPLLAALPVFAIFQMNRFASLLIEASTQFQAATATGDWRGYALRALLLSWMLIAAYVAAWGLVDRARDWTYFRWKSGEQVLPNISSSNSQVIRYLQYATPPGSKILVLSDQKLFFLSYYLLPRRLVHPIHKDAEFVIPLANNARQLSAYQLADLTPEEIARRHPDYILEYFEGAEYTSAARHETDSDWVRFWQASSRSSELPPYTLKLTKYHPQVTP